MMSKKFLNPILLFVLMVLAGSVVAYGGAAEGSKEKPRGLDKVATNDMYKTMLINNIFNYYSNNGDMSFNPFSAGNEGFEFPKGSGGQIMFEEGLVWTGYNALFNSATGKLSPVTLKASGSTYYHSLQAGPILQAGTATSAPVAAPPGDAKYRIYRVREDITPADWAGGGTAQGHKVAIAKSDALTILAQEEVPLISRFESYTADQLYQLYLDDWNNWPASLGAPFQYGKDAAGVQRTSPAPYDPHFDIPGQPGADMTLWYVSNDLDVVRVFNFYGSSEGTGMEEQVTIWAYKRASNTALGNTIFSGFKLINKSGMKIDTMYVSFWSDPDMGGTLGATDNFSGCDVGRSLGFIWNGTACNGNPVYGCSPPAGGQVFFQGPIVPSPGDSAIFDLQYRQGFKNLKLSAYNIFINGSTTYGDPRGKDPRGTLDWYHLMQGLVAQSGAQQKDPTTGLVTKFLLSGDPVTGQGWIEGGPNGIAPPGDRRQCLVAGPFVMNNGDTQQVVCGSLAGRGSDKVSSVSVLRFYTDQAQGAYNVLFQLPSPPAAPKVTTTELDGEIVLSWDDPATIAVTETQNDKGFAFQGYNVYQMPGGSSTGAVLLATYDIVDLVLKVQDFVFDATVGTVILKPVQFGNDSGLIHFYETKTDHFSTFGNKLANGQPYYFAVTAYNYNSTHGVTPNNLETGIKVLKVTPHQANPGTRYGAGVRDTVKGVTQTVAPGGAPSEGTVTPVIINPDSLKGHTYKVSFDETGGNFTWLVTDVTTGQVKVKNQTNLSGDIQYPIVDGQLIRVVGPPAGMKPDDVNSTSDESLWGWKIPSGTRRWTWSGAGGSMEGFGSVDGESGGTIGSAASFWGGNLTPGDLHNVLLVLAATDTAGTLANAADTTASYAYRFMRACQSPAAKPAFAPFIIHGAGSTSYDFQDYVKGVPLAAYDMDAKPPKRLALMFLENNVANGLVDGKYWPPLAGTDNIATTSAREWLFITNAPYTGAAADPTLETNLNTGSGAMPLMWAMIPDRRANVGWAVGDQFLIIANHVFTTFDSYSWTAPSTVTGDLALAKADVNKINVFPNPYFGFNPAELNKVQRFVTFTHLPTNATIRIFNLAGVLVRTIIANNNTTQTATWDLRNASNIPAAAGMYIAFIDLPDLGLTKTLKLGIIPGQQFLDRY
jgi:hypothetical protein